MLLRPLLIAVVSISASIIVVSTPARPGPVGTAFSYQGSLSQGGTPVNDAADFQFSLFDEAVGGNQIGTTQAANAIDVVDGGFTVDIDFGSGVFGVDARWLDIAVRSPAGSGVFTPLMPRQMIRPAPVAQYALNADGANVANLNASNITTGVIANAQTSGSASSTANSLVLRDASGNFAANMITASGFSGSGAALINLNANTLSSGTIPDARLSSNVATLLGVQNFVGTKTFADRIGIGTISPLSAYRATFRADGLGTPVAGAAFQAGSNNGVFLGYPAPNDTANFELWNANAGYVRFGTNNGERVRIDSAGNVGIGITSPSSRLHVAGDATVNGTINATSVSLAPVMKTLYVWPTDFRPKSGDVPHNFVAYNVHSAEDAGINGATSPYIYFAVVRLPAGAVVEEFRAYMHDDTAQSLTVKLMAVLGSNMASVISANGVDTYVDDTISAPVILGNQDYIIESSFSAAVATSFLRLNRVEIDYTIAATIP